MHHCVSHASLTCRARPKEWVHLPTFFVLLFFFCSFCFFLFLSLFFLMHFCLIFSFKFFLIGRRAQNLKIPVMKKRMKKKKIKKRKQNELMKLSIGRKGSSSAHGDAGVWPGYAYSLWYWSFPLPQTHMYLIPERHKDLCTSKEEASW